MRRPRLLFALFFLLFTRFATAQLQVKVIDPQSAAVAGARVTLMEAATSRVVAVTTSTAEGKASFERIADGKYEVEVLAPGFAPQQRSLTVPQQTELEITLSVATALRTVVVSATLTPLTEEESGAPVSTLGRDALTAMQPVSAAEALRFATGTIINAAGRRGGQASLFVRGGESSYNRVVIDGVPVNDPGGFFDFGVVPLQDIERVEVARGAESALYGSDAMTSAVRLWTRTGQTRLPELRFGADGGNFSTAHGFGSLAGARGRFDYNLFADQVAAEGQDINDDYSNSSQGLNAGVSLGRNAFLRLRARHSNNRSGVQGAWNFNGQPLLAPDQDQFARQNNMLASAELGWNAPGRWQHRLSGFEYRHRRLNVDAVADRGCDFATFVFIDCPFDTLDAFNRAGFTYQAEYAPRRWARSVFGYEFEDEHGDTRDRLFGSSFGGLRRNHALYAEQIITAGRFAIAGGLRFAHNQSFGNKAVPRGSISVLVAGGGGVLSGTRLRFAAAEGIKAPDFLESFGSVAFSILPNSALKPEQNRGLEAGVQQTFFGGKYSLVATYFNNTFHNRIVFRSLGPPAFLSQFVNVERALAHGAEVEAHARFNSRLQLSASYGYTSTQVLRAPLNPASLGQPLLRRPKHNGSLLLVYAGRRWGGSFGGTMVGRRTDSDFLGFGVDYAAGYARFDVGAWRALNRRATAYINIENLFDKDYNEVVGYPGLGRNVRAGLRFRIGGE